MAFVIVAGVRQKGHRNLRGHHLRGSVNKTTVHYTIHRPRPSASMLTKPCRLPWQAEGIVHRWSKSNEGETYGDRDVAAASGDWRVG